MKLVSATEVQAYIESHIGDFHSARLNSLKSLRLEQVLRRKNPYLFKAKGTFLAQDLVKTILDAHLSSQEETLFGKLLEGLAIYISSLVYNGRKASGEGFDLDFEKGNKRYVVSIKSGPNWGNSSQIAKMVDNFKKAKKIIRQVHSTQEVIAINGCCYGKDDNPDKGDYFKLCGQRFWELISGDSNLYTDIIEPLGHRAKARNDEFQEHYAQIVNQFTEEFGQKFCRNGRIDWQALVKFNSAAGK
ncbi:MAG: PmeII family type II restriction endonuclease [Chloroflexota bacterium]